MDHLSYINYVKESDIALDFKAIKREMSRNPVLSKVLYYVYAKRMVTKVH